MISGAFCAICTASITGEPRRRPLGKDDAMVNVCVGCDGEDEGDGEEEPSTASARAARRFQELQAARTGPPLRRGRVTR